VHPDELLEAIRREGATLAATLSHDLTPEVPSCPGWSLETLANHCGRVHRWATAVVRTRATERPDFPRRPPVVDHEWFEEGVQELAAALEEAGPEAPCWNFMNQPAEVRFWFRRQAHETSVHRWDAQNAVAPGGADPIDVELALDGVDELLDVILPLGYQGDDLGGTVHLHATDSPHGEWLIMTTDGELLIGHDHQKGDAAVRATASDLLLWLWGRQALDSAPYEVFGDAALAGRLRDVLKTP
jgi:uncharacterized protein (TIGR03083 family)